MTDFIDIDGSFGEGGGQILRSSLSLSLVTGRPLRMNNIRAGRKKPGLLRQHLTAVNAATEIGKAHVTGNALGSRMLKFEPEKVVPGEYTFSIGTAGSTMLVLETILPALMLAETPSILHLKGGTHNPQSPPYEFFKSTLVPLLELMGPKIEPILFRHGFYPAGGGEVYANIIPVSKLSPLVLTERGPLIQRRAMAMLSKLPSTIAGRELNTVANEAGWLDSELTTVQVKDSPGPGNILLLCLKFEKITEIFTGVGELGIRSEDVARNAVKQMKDYLRYDVPVGEYTADQLLLPCGIAAWQGVGSTFRTLPLSGHSLTHIELLRKFLDIEINIKTEKDGAVQIVFGSGGDCRSASSP